MRKDKQIGIVFLVGLGGFGLIAIQALFLQRFPLELLPTLFFLVVVEMVIISRWLEERFKMILEGR